MNGVLGDGVVYKKAFAGAVKTFSDSLAQAAHVKAMARKTERGELIVAYANAQNKASTGQAGAVAAQRHEWKDRAEAGLPFDDSTYVTFYPVHEAALASLEPSFIETYIPLYGTAYSASNNFSKGNITAGIFDLALGLPVYAVGKGLFKGGSALVRGLGRLGAKAGTKLRRPARAALSASRGPLKASARNRGMARVPFSPTVATQPNRIYSARELIRRADEPGPFHNFPESFNDDIFERNRSRKLRSWGLIGRWRRYGQGCPHCGA